MLSYSYEEDTFILFRPVNFYRCKSVNLLTTSVPYTGDDGGTITIYCVYVHIY